MTRREAHDATCYGSFWDAYTHRRGSKKLRGERSNGTLHRYECPCWCHRRPTEGGSEGPR